MLHNQKQLRNAERQRKQAIKAKRIKLEKAAPELLTACESFLIGWSHFCGCVDFGRSNLDGPAIRFINEVPGKIQQAFDKAKED